MDVLGQFKVGSILLEALASIYPEEFRTDQLVYLHPCVESSVNKYVSRFRHPGSIILSDPELELMFGISSLATYQVEAFIEKEFTPLNDLTATNIKDWPLTRSPRFLSTRLAQQKIRNFDIDAYYKPSPMLRKLLQKADTIDNTQKVFSYREIMRLVSQYILQNKDRFFDLRNIHIVHVENDILGEMFRVKYIARQQITSFIRSKLTKTRCVQK